MYGAKAGNRVFLLGRLSQQEAVEEFDYRRGLAVKLVFHRHHAAVLPFRRVR